jgi:hypothetical protein
METAKDLRARADHYRGLARFVGDDRMFAAITAFVGELEERAAKIGLADTVPSDAMQAIPALAD